MTLARLNRILLSSILVCLTASAATIPVGSKSKFKTPCQAFANAKDGDTLLLDAATTFDGDVCAITRNRLTIRGVNGRPHIRSADKSFQGKAIWVVQGNDNIIENIEMSGVHVPSHNGAPIRLEAGSLTLRGVSFHDNEEGFLTTAAPGHIQIDFSEFARNGDGRGYAHNIYIGGGHTFEMRFCTVQAAVVGNLVKSRAKETRLLYNRIGGETYGSESWEVDLPDGGNALLVGNIIVQGPQSPNPNMISFMTEGAQPGSTLRMAYNTVVNLGRPGVFIQPGPRAQFQGVLTHNIFQGPGRLTTPSGQVALDLRDNLWGTDARFVSAERQDFRLQPNSPARGKVVRATQEEEIMLPRFQYRPEACGQDRPAASLQDLGAIASGVSWPASDRTCPLYTPEPGPASSSRR